MILPLKDMNPTRRTPWVTWALVAANALVFLYQYAVVGLETSILKWGLIPQRLFDSAPLQMPSSYGWIVADADPVATLFTSMFMHAGLLHLAGNMLYLWIFGNNIEDRLGPLRFLGFYLAGGLLADLSHVAISTLSFTGAHSDSIRMPLVGASGAVAAVLGAYYRLYPRARVRCLLFLFFFVTIIQLPAALVLGWWIVIQLFNGVLGVGMGSSGIAWFAHIGGFFGGMLLLTLLGVKRRPRLSMPD